MGEARGTSVAAGGSLLVLTAVRSGRGDGTVGELLAGAGIPDPNGWLARAVAAPFALVGRTITGWEGDEWAVDGPDDAPVWAEPADGRTPFAWLRCRTDGADAVVSTYQDDGAFGLSFLPYRQPELMAAADGILRPRPDVDLARGTVERISVVLDREAGDASGPAVLTEVLVETAAAATLLVAAEAYGRDDWRRYDESVVALPDPAAADRLPWFPASIPWRPADVREDTAAGCGGTRRRGSSSS